MYADGRGLAEDAADAAQWFRRAATQSTAGAQYDFRIVYADRREVPQDDVNILMWLELAAARSTGAVKELVGESRDTIAQRMTHNQIAEAQRRARAWDAIQQRDP